jgi:hypothetical protein
MASPHVAGLAALLLSVQPNLTPAQVEQIMVDTATKNLGAATEYGGGLIQAASALAAVGGQPVTPVPPTVTTAPLPATPTFTPIPPTLTPVPPTVTPVPPTFTPIPPTVTPVPPTVTSVPPTVTPVPPTFTPIPQVTTVPITVTPILTTVPVTPAPPLPAGELLKSPGFETDEAWVFGDTPVRGAYDTSLPLTGSRSVRLGITSGPGRYSFSSVWQRVTIPPEAKQVRLSANVYAINQGGNNTQTVMILDQNFRVLRTLSRESSNSQSWSARSYDLSELAGRTVYIYFSVVNQGGPPAAMYVDDVSLTWAP